jgi:hypothetical protein
MSCPQNIRYLYPDYDYENFEFRSKVNPWNPQSKYSADFDKMKCLEFTLVPGKTLFIPAYWWYSIKFNSNTSISCFHYRTYMNNVAVLPYIGMHALQIQNVKRNIVKKASIQELNTEVINPLETQEELYNQDNIQDNIQDSNQDNIPDSNQENLVDNGRDINNLPEPASFENNIGSQLD